MSLIVYVAARFGIGSLATHFQSVALANVTSLLMMVTEVLVLANIVLVIISVIKPKSHRIHTILTIVNSFIKYAAAIIILCWGLSILGVNVSTIAASVGILALIVGFGAQSLIEDVITGLFMIFENQFNVEDIIEVGGFCGTVYEIGVRTTSIKDLGGNIKIINNSQMKNILNRSDVKSTVVCDIPIPYETDLEELEKSLPDISKCIFEKYNEVFLGEPQYAGVQELADSAIVLRFIAPVKETNIYHAKRVLNREYLLGLKKKNVQCPYNKIDVHNI